MKWCQSHLADHLRDSGGAIIGIILFGMARTSASAIFSCNLPKERKGKMKEVMCNWTPHCENTSCPHHYPHSPIAGTDTEFGHPQCEDKGTFCYSENRAVNCVEVREGVQNETLD